MKKLLRNLLWCGAALFTASPAIAADVPESLYMMGNIPGNSWQLSINDPIKGSSPEYGVFVFEKITLQNRGENAWFSFYDILTDDWDIVNGEDGTYHRYGSGELTPSTAHDMSLGGDTSFNIQEGTYTFTINFNGNTPTVTAVATLPDCYIIGSYVDGKSWELGSAKMTYENNKYTWTGSQLKWDFKINNGSWNTGVSIGANNDNNTITIGQPLLVVNGGESNIFVPDFTLIINPTVVLDFETMQLTVTGTTETYGPLWAVIGSYNNWGFDNAQTFSGSGETLNCSIDYLTTGFKIVDIANNNWTIQYGTSDKVIPGQTYNLTKKEGEADPPNIEFGNQINAINNAQLKWNPSTASLEINASEEDIEAGYPTLYFTGSITNWCSPQESPYKGSKEENIYSFVVNLGDTGDVAFKVASYGWGEEYAGGKEIGTEVVKVEKGGGDLTTKLTGMQTLYFNYDTLEMWFEEYIEPLPTQIYLIGNMQEGGDWNINSDEFTLVETEVGSGIYEGTFEFPEHIGKWWFSFYSVLAWDNSKRVSPKVNDASVDFTKGVYTCETVSNTDNSWILANWAGGKMTISIDLNNNTATFTTSEDYEPLPIPEPDGKNIYLIGTMNDWNYQNSDYTLTVQEDGSYQGTFDLPVSYDSWWFRFYKALYDLDSYSIGASEKDLEIDLASGEFTDQASNNTNCWVLPYWPGGEITFTVSADFSTVTFTTEVEFVMPGPAPLGDVIYMIGDMNNWNIDNQDYTLDLDEEGVYMATFEIQAQTENNNYKDQYFRFYTISGSWNEINSVGASVDNLKVTFSDNEFESKLLLQSENCWILPAWEGGEIIVTVDFNNEAVSIVLVENGTDGPEDPETPEGNGGTFEGETETAEFDNGSTIDFDWSATWNKEATITFTLTLDSDMQGVVPQMYIDGVYVGDFKQVTSTKAVTTWSYTTSDTYSQDDDTDFAVGFKTPNSQSNQVVLPYTIGSVSSSTGNGSGSGSGSDSGDGDGDDDDDDNGGTTSVDSLENDNAEVVIYNLQGVRVDRNKLTRGIYIINGKKVLVK